MLAETRVHPLEIGSEQRRLVPAGAGSDFDDGVSVVDRVVRNQGRFDRGFELDDSFLERDRLGSCLGGELWIVDGKELAHLRELFLGLLELRPEFDDGSQPRVLAA